MKSKNFIALVFFAPTILYYIIFVAYLLKPTLFHFRALELYEIFVFNGVHSLKQTMVESGDSSREFLIQRYQSKNDISVNELGNRISCFDKQDKSKKSVLLLGDSQLWGAGVDDKNIFSSQLCKQFNANIYNAASKNGLRLITTEEYKFDSILFTTDERRPLSSYCSQLNNLEANYHKKTPLEFMTIKTSFNSLIAMITGSFSFIDGYLRNRVHALFSLYKTVAPEDHLIKHQHSKSTADIAADMACAIRIRDFFLLKNVQVGFLYFPAHQTIYGREGHLNNVTRNFIDVMSTQLKKESIKSLNSKQCLLDGKKRTLVYQKHDSHINGNGFALLAQCTAASDLAALFK